MWSELLYRALENVIRNAIKYTVNRIIIDVSIEHCPILKTLLIMIKDRDIGVPESDFNAIFQPFFRIDSSIKTTSFGLGLAIA